MNFWINCSSGPSKKLEKCIKYHLSTSKIVIHWLIRLFILFKSRLRSFDLFVQDGPYFFY